MGFKVGGIYKIDVIVKDNQSLSLTITSKEELWHLRYGNLNHNGLRLLQKKKKVEYLLVFMNEHAKSNGCALGKQHINEFHIHTNKMKR